jgi:hypothetical protein
VFRNRFPIGNRRDIKTELNPLRGTPRLEGGENYEAEDYAVCRRVGRRPVRFWIRDENSGPKGGRLPIVPDRQLLPARLLQVIAQMKSPDRKVRAFFVS